MIVLQLVTRADHSIFLYLQAITGQTVKRLARIISFSADGWLLLAFLCWLQVEQNSSETLTNSLLTALLVERLIYWVLKNTTKRYRPGERMVGFQALITAADRFSFPSGHTSAAALLAVFVIVTFPELYLIAGCWVIMVALSRVLLGVHFPTDTLAGAVLGSLCAVWSLHLLG